LRREVHRQMGTPIQPESPENSHGSLRNNYVRGKETLMVGQRHAAPAHLEQPTSVFTNATVHQSAPGGIQSPNFLEGPLGPSDDLGILDNLEGSIWWAQLDSWVSRCPLQLLQFPVPVRDAYWSSFRRSRIL
jgi:hypothetical protein